MSDRQKQLLKQLADLQKQNETKFESQQKTMDVYKDSSSAIKPYSLVAHEYANDDLPLYKTSRPTGLIDNQKDFMKSNILGYKSRRRVRKNNAQSLSIDYKNISAADQQKDSNSFANEYMTARKNNAMNYSINY